MVKKFFENWREKETDQPSYSHTIPIIGKPPESVKDQINTAIQRLDIQTKTLDCAVKRFETRDATIFQCVVKAISNRDKARANILASELWEIRKVEKMLMHESLALESICMRLKTVSELGDVVAVLGPAASMLREVRSGMSSVLPEASQELESIGSLLNDIVTSTNQSTESPVNIGAANADAQKILEEAEVAAEVRLKEQFPDVTTKVATAKKTVLELS